MTLKQFVSFGSSATKITTKNNKQQQHSNNNNYNNYIASRGNNNNYYYYYRATLCVSAVFAIVRCLSDCLSVRVTRWCIVSTRLKILSNFFLGPVNPSFYFFFWLRAPIPNSKGTLQRGCKIHGVWFVCDFRLISPLTLETVRDRPVVTMEL